MDSQAVEDNKKKKNNNKNKLAGNNKNKTLTGVVKTRAIRNRTITWGVNRTPPSPLTCPVIKFAFSSLLVLLLAPYIY